MCRGEVKITVQIEVAKRRRHPKGPQEKESCVVRHIGECAVAVVAHEHRVVLQTAHEQIQVPITIHIREDRPHLAARRIPWPQQSNASTLCHVGELKVTLIAEQQIGANVPAYEEQVNVPIAVIVSRCGAACGSVNHDTIGFGDRAFAVHRPPTDSLSRRGRMA